MPDEGVLFEQEFKDNNSISHHVEVSQAVVPNGADHYYCLIDGHIEIAIGLDDNASWVDLEENEVTEWSAIIGNLIENKAS